MTDGNSGRPARPLVTFYRMIEQARLPQRADRSAAGTLPTRAYRYCHAVTTAAGYGWYVFPPMEFSLLWDGEQVFWTFAGADEWLPLSAAQFPHFAQAFDAAAPDEAKGFSPPFLTALPEPGHLQIWSGLIARTAPDWSLLVRSPPNLPGGAGYELFEGVVESDQWFGPLFINLRLTRTHAPVRFDPNFPLFQAQPVPRLAYAEETLRAMTTVGDLRSWGRAEWEDYAETVVRPSADEHRPHGQYAVAARKRRTGCPFSGGRM